VNPERVAVSRPNNALVKLPDGFAKLAWLNTLNAFASNLNRTRSPMGMLFIREAS
jgi:hypothetical protein